ncbi:hypothetical protein GCM10020331_035790 [Ectobacillus funiculus]
MKKELRGLDYDMKEVLSSENLKRVAEKFNFPNEEEMYAAVGYNGITAAQIVTRLTDKFRKKKEEAQLLDDAVADAKTQPMKIKRRDTGIKVSGVDNLLIRVSKCCNPVPGDDIIGYITKGRGVSVHRADCVNTQTDEAKDRLLEVEWEISPQRELEYNVDLEISGFDRRGLFK